MLQPDAPVVRPEETCGVVAAHCRETIKLDRSLAWKPVRDERYASVFALVAKGSSTVTHSNEVARLNNTRDSNLNRDSTKHIPQVLNARFSGAEYARDAPADVANLDSGERRGYWKYCARQMAPSGQSL
ncbi:unnamed protein product [Phytophthora fragariaefolia]|uniref:Unnamed protein product n=1 Tax=Phytophthora fragariaefolia TaxID=1490495 RepID=A0A9W6X904_9STRA|nr:unnamed protein product [Phytophthora fragariaefolia]